MDLKIYSEFDGAAATVSVIGEVDVSNADLLRDAIDEAMSLGAIASIGVDLAQVPYIDSTGIGVLVGSAHKAREAGKAFATIDPQDNVARIMGLLGVDEVIDVKRSHEHGM